MSFLFDLMNTAKSGLAPAVAAPPNSFGDDLNTAASSGYAGASSGYGGGYYGKCVYCCEDDDKGDNLNELLAAAAGLAGATALLAVLLNSSLLNAGRSFPETFLFDYYDYTVPGNS